MQAKGRLIRPHDPRVVHPRQVGERWSTDSITSPSCETGSQFRVASSVRSAGSASSCRAFHDLRGNQGHCSSAYAFGRTTSKAIVEDGRKRVRSGLRRARTDWDVLPKDQHEGDITWAEFERNQRVIANNAAKKGSAMARGAAR